MLPQVEKHAYFIRESVEIIEKECFIYSKLVLVTIASSVIEIGEAAFLFLKGLEAQDKEIEKN